MGRKVCVYCDCGYEKELLLGGGIMARNQRRIRPLFSAMDLSGFEQALQTRQNYDMSSHMGYCQACEELVSVPVLRYTLSGKEFTLQKPCPNCAGAVALRESPGSCPKCGKPLRERVTGMWD